MIRLRLKRMGRRHRPFYRINAMDSRSPRDGRVIEELGYYDPLANDQEQQLSLKADRVQYWLSKGAQPSDTVRDLLRRNGIDVVVGNGKSSKTGVSSGKADPQATAAPQDSVEPSAE